MDIGTAKPTAAERAAVTHHLIDIRNPDETVSLGEYQALAFATIDRIHARRRLPLLVGGTGQYVMAVVEGWGIPRVPPHPALRRALRRENGAELHRWLTHLDPAAAAAIHPHNVRRVVRALEVTLVSGRPISELQRKTPPSYDIYMVGLRADRNTLYARIDERVEQMMADGLLEEMLTLKAQGFGPTLPAMSGLGYRQLWEHVQGKLPLAEAVERIKFETHRFVRHQNNWFQADDRRIEWFDITHDDATEAIANNVARWLEDGRGSQQSKAPGRQSV
jgi:tRNA dimethylallyltransferase